MRAGIATVDITPPVGTELSGGAFGPAREVLHPLAAKVLLLEQDDQRVCLIGCDLLGFGADLAVRIRRSVSRACGTAFDAVCLTATHTHGAPGTVWLRTWGRVDPDYCDALVGKITDAAAQAADALTPARVGSAATDCPGVTVNRCGDEPQATCDRLTVLRVEEADGKPLAAAVAFACHPVNLHDSGQVTPDFPHYLQQELQKAVQAQIPVLYFNGASGDLNPANFQPHQPSEQAAEQTAGRIAACAAEAWGDSNPRNDAELGFAALDTALPLAPLPDRQQIEQILAERTAELEGLAPDPGDWEYCRHQAAVEWARQALDALKAGNEQKALPITLQGIRIGDAAAVAIPGELFSRFGNAIADDDSFEVTFPITLANGCVGYLPDPAAYERQGYEAVHCPRYLGLQAFAPSVGERITEAARTLLAQLGHMQANPASRTLWGQSCNVIVGGGQAHKRPVKYLYRGGPAFAVRAKGARFWDADGREYIDYLLGYGPIVIGHCDEQVNAAVSEQINGAGTVFSVEHPLAIDLAEQLVGLIPSAEMVMFFLGGSSATLGGIRVARAHTGREMVIRCGYHGWYDAFPPLAKGVAAHARQRMVSVDYNDADALAETLEAHAGQVAAVIIESVQGDGPAEGYFDRVRSLCDQHGAVFILDEVKTGFRFAMGGAQERFGIAPDLSCFGKAMCNGYPGSVLVGRREVLEDRADTFLAATFHSDLLSVAAARAVIGIMRDRNGIEHFQRLGTRLIEQSNAIFAEKSLPLRIAGFPAMPDPAETKPDDADNPMPPAWQGKVFGAFFGAMQRRGIYVTGHPWFLSLAHTDADIDQTLEVTRAAAGEALDELTRLAPAGARSAT
jgi:glutamate-1-semialdehyde aminotransferase